MFSSHVGLYNSHSPCLCRHSYLVLVATAEECAAVSAWTQRVSANRKCPRLSVRSPALERARKYGKEIRHVVLINTLGLRLHTHLSISDTEVLYLNAPGVDMVVLSTSDAVSDLLDQRSAIYSDKVRSHSHSISTMVAYPFYKPSTPMIEL